MKKTWVIGFCALVVILVYCGVDSWTENTRECAFYRGGWCLACEEEKEIPVGYKENCDICSNRQALYVAEGLIPAWACVLSNQVEDDQENWQPAPVRIDRSGCPFVRPLRDIVGNCYPCDTRMPVRLSDWTAGDVCDNRYNVPDRYGNKSMLCPPIEEIVDAEMCFHCGGVMLDGFCRTEGENRFCSENSDCKQGEWCYPLKISEVGQKGICTVISEKKWICSETDGYDVEQAKLFCTRQGAHIPTMQELEKELSDVMVACVNNDIWTFFDKENAIWLESFNREFLFTRENEKENLGGNTFHALCRVD